MSEVLDLDGLGQVELLKNRYLTPLELMDATISRIEKVEPSIRALSYFDFEKARDQAKKITSQNNGSRPFHGLPLLIKDNTSVPGMPLTYGSRLFLNNVGVERSDYITRLEQAGFIFIGKSSVSEFSILPSTESLLMGVTKNPWNLDYSASGSSGGAAAAVSAGMMPLAHANDVGGSIRLPASVCGLFGFKPSVGRCVSATMHQSNLSELMIHHCVSHSVRDSAMFLNVTQNGYQSIPLSAAKPYRSLRIALFQSNYLNVEVDQEISYALEQTAQMCRSLGHRVEYVDFSHNIDSQAICDAFMYVAAETVANIANIMATSLRVSKESLLLEPYTKELIHWYEKNPQVQAKKPSFQSVKCIFDDYFKEYDVLLSPTLPMLPYKIGELSPVSDFSHTVDMVKNISAYTSLLNISGGAAMSVPLHQAANGLPIGMQFSADKGHDQLLFELAYLLEQSFPWRKRIPKK
ncbi:Putative amidase AmiC [Pseudoalteromonas holothuriae]|uniref:Amidase AmiC n=1 Tax=Pseudoalteromonas holothuriae TaxID=2963714 RepID=A0ABM9GNM2_9GAMM|nr:amidase family protein [Pseudoalteromonas sp. CIP111951]CAH9068220.1 Putative amidase AmiC [Pseudoalteromonas sp. CIP111951]